MALSITPLAVGRQRAASTAWPLLIEALFTLAAVAALFPLFETFARSADGRDARFADTAVSVTGLPPRVLPASCGSHAAHAEALLRDRLCAGVPLARSASALDRMPVAVVDAYARIKVALAASGGSAPVTCAYELVRSAIGQPGGPHTQMTSEAARTNALLLLAAALDGDAGTGAVARRALLPESTRSIAPACAPSLVESLATAAAFMAEARHASLNGRKNAATRDLLRSAGEQWAIAMLAGLVLLNFSRRPGVAGFGAALAFATWALLAWLGRVPWPFAGDRALVLAREAPLSVAMPAPFVLGLLALGVLVAALSLPMRGWLHSTPQTPASRIGYPGFVVATGLGALLLLDLSSNANASNRFLALYHQGHLWLAMLVLTVVAFLRQPLARALAWILSMLDGWAGSIGRRLGAVGATGSAILLSLALIAAFGALLANLRQVTSEIGRLWLMLGAAWFFFLRGGPFAERLARSGPSWASLARYVAPLAFVVAVLIGAMVLTRDMGPLLIAGYAAGAFVAASASMWLDQRYGYTRSACALGLFLFAGWIAAVTFALFQIGSIDDVTAARLENVAAPLASANDQLALITWFQQVAPPNGFGLGAVPWCGYGGSTGCAGVPAQIQSDYTFSAIVGTFGATAAWTVTIGCAVWLHRLIRHHGRVTTGEPRFVTSERRVANDEQAFASWLAVTWVVLALCQLAVTVAGNLAVIPLTGVTFPFVSFGMTSLVVNCALLGLCINVNIAGRGPR